MYAVQDMEPQPQLQPPSAAQRSGLSQFQLALRPCTLELTTRSWPLGASSGGDGGQGRSASSTVPCWDVKEQQQHAPAHTHSQQEQPEITGAPSRSAGSVRPPGSVAGSGGGGGGAAPEDLGHRPTMPLVPLDCCFEIVRQASRCGPPGPDGCKPSFVNVAVNVMSSAHVDHDVTATMFSFPITARLMSANLSC
jgi:hypothetical protein